MKNNRGLWMAGAGALAVALVAGVTMAADEAGKWTSLINGKDLDGWKQQGDGVYSVQDGCLVGTQTDGKGGDLFTTNQFDNFELRFTYKVAWPANSGIWFRDQYQFDILKYPNPVAFSGTLYCPGKMFITTNLVESLEKRDDWNEGRIFAQGDHLVMWLNGTKVSDAHDGSHAKGRIGVQVHGGEGFKNMKITIKRLELRPLAAGEQPAS
jgi:hypothetical protein